MRHCSEDVEDVAFDQRQHHLSFGVAETGVELDHLDTLRGFHQSGIQHTRQRTTLCTHGRRGRFQNMLQGKSPILIGDERQTRVGAHTACVRSLVAIEGALVVLRKRHRIYLLAIHKAHERELGTGEEVFHHHLAIAEVRVGEHILEGSLGLLQILRNHHPLAGSESVVFEHGRERSRLHIRQCLGIVGKAAITSGRNTVFHHQLLGKLFAALDASG